MRRIAITMLAATVLAGAAGAGAGLGAGVAEAGTGRPGSRATLQRDADALLTQGAPGVLVHLDTARGEVRVRSGLGDVAAGTPVPWNARFRIGSFTKTYVAATVLQLVGEGRLGLDDRVEKWLPGTVAGRPVTVRQLLQHTSGLPEYLQGMPWLFRQETFEQRRYETVTAREAVRLAMTFPPEFAPGARWSYSNTNYMLAGLLIERVTGHRWQQEVRDRIVRPLGLRDTFLPGTRPDIPGPHAVGYERFPGPDATEDDPHYGEPVDVTRLNPSWGGAAGEMISTTDDGNRFLRALLGGRVLRPAELAEMTRTVPANDDFRENWPGARYGLGIVWTPSSCGGSWSHGGDIHGFKTRNGVTRDGSRSVLVSINTDSLKRLPGVPAPTADVTIDLIDHALCGTR